MLQYVIHKLSKTRLGIGFTLFFAGGCFLIEFNNSVALLRFTELPMLERLTLLLLNIYDTFLLLPIYNQVLIVAVSVLASFNTILLIEYYKLVDGFSLKQGLPSNLGLVMTLLGTGCSVCGGVALTYVASLTGAYTAVVLEWHLLSSIGIVVMSCSTYFVLKKIITTSKVCR